MLIERLVKIVGVCFFIFYIIYRIILRIHEYQAHPQLFTPFAHINWLLIMTTFVLYMVGYILRKPPVVSSKNWKENVFPIFCASLSYFIYESPRWASFSWLRDTAFQKFFITFIPFNLARPSALSMILLISGNVILALGLYQLRSCFSVFVQARGVVRTGIYRYIRHPLYIGQTLTTIGSCLWIPSWCNIALTLIFIPLQRLRAHIEEKKLSATFPEYAHYKKSTGAYFPKILNKA